MPKYKTVKRNEQGKLIYTYDRETNNKYRRGSCISHKLAGSKRHAKAKKLEHTIDLTYLRNLWNIQKGLCKYSGLPLGNIGDGLYSPSIDRIDSSKGYIEGNVQWVCWGINDMKSNLNESEFIRLCSLVAERATTISKESTPEAIAGGSAGHP